MGLIKAVLCLQHRTIPPQAGFDTLNPRIDAAGTGLVIPTEARPWGPEPGEYASVSSYGMSGTNAYAVLSTAPEHDPLPGNPPQASGFLVSARTPAALAELAGRYRDRLVELPDAAYPAFAYTATHGRTRLPHAAWVAATSPSAAAEALAGFPDHPAVRPLAESDPLPGDDGVARRMVTTLPGYPWQHVTHVVPAVPASAEEKR
jgi:acyl transferase domain-containing protein